MKISGIFLFSTAVAAVAFSAQVAASTGTGTLVWSRSDASGIITTSLFLRAIPQVNGLLSDFGVQVPSDYVVVGGGVREDGSPGRFITASYPSPDLSTWFVSDKDDLIADVGGTGTAYAIGMKIRGMTAAQVRSSMMVANSISDVGDHTDVSTTLPSNYVLLGGGVRMQYTFGAPPATREGNMVTGSFPFGANTWRVTSKDQVKPDPEASQAFAIGLLSTLPGVGKIYQETWGSPVISGEFPTSSASLPSYGADQLALTGCGAQVNYSGAGQLLYRLSFNNPDVQGGEILCNAASKDQYVTDTSGLLQSFAVGIRVVPN